MKPFLTTTTRLDQIKMGKKKKKLKGKKYLLEKVEEKCVAGKFVIPLFVPNSATSGWDQSNECWIHLIVGSFTFISNEGG